MGTSQRCFSAGLLACAFFFGGCSHTNTSLSPLVGSWKIKSNVSASSASTPQFTALTFKPDGSLDASYVAANGTLAHIVQAAPQIKQEKDSYALGEASTLHINEGSRTLDYTYDIHDGKLYLTPSNANNAVVYVRVADS